MLRLNLINLRRVLLRGAGVAGIVLASVIITLLVQRLVTPPHAAAQNGVAQEVRALKFTLVAPDGTVIGVLQQAAQGGGGGALALFDSTGKARLRATAGTGVFSIFDPDGTTPRLRAGYSLIPGPSGEPPFSGIQLDPQGAITILSVPQPAP